MADEWMLVANVVLTHRFFRNGAKVVIFNPNWGNAGERVEVRGLSRSGASVQSWIPLHYLSNFRAKWRPPHVSTCHPYETRADAEAHAQALEQRAVDERTRRERVGTPMTSQPKEDTRGEADQT